MQFVQQPVQGLGENGQPAIVFDQFQTGRQGLQRLFFLWADKQTGLHCLACTRCDRLQRRNQAH